MFINKANTNAEPSILVYDGAAVPLVLTSKLSNLQSAAGYYVAFRTLNRAGWSALSPYLSFIAGLLPSPPPKAPKLISSSTA